MTHSRKSITSYSEYRMTSKLLFKLLPVQILLASIGSINGIFSGLFASNFIGATAMSAVGLFGPINQLLVAISTMLVTGATILCGKFMGKNQIGQMQSIFTLDMILCTIISAVVTAVLLIMGLFDLTTPMAPDAVTRGVLNSYIIGQAVGIFPMIVGQQLAAFLSLENNPKRTTIASIVYIIANLILNFLFIQVLRWEAFGLAIASSIGLWIFMIVQGQFFFTEQSSLRLSFRNINWKDGLEITKIGIPGAIGNGYITIRGFIVNGLIMAYVGSAGISAFAASDAILKFFWAIPTGMLAVSRMLMSVAVGEEDKNTLTNVMRVAMFKFIPLMLTIALCIMALAKPFTMMFYRDPMDPVFDMTLWAFRILPLCMPLAIVCMHFSCYGLASNKQFLVHLLAILDGFVTVCIFTALLIKPMGIEGVYAANVINGVLDILVIFIYALIMKKKIPTNMEELMVIPDDFGVDDDHRLELSVLSMEDVIGISEKVQTFCKERGVGSRRSFLSSLALEEMAGNVVKHGFSMDDKSHTSTVRTIIKDEDIILCIKDDCQPFDPVQRQKIADPDDKSSNIGLRIVYGTAKDISYQNILGLNVLTVKI